MSVYDPETLNLLRIALDQAWLRLPDNRKTTALKSEMAQRILRKASEGVRDPIRLQAAALAAAARPHGASEARGGDAAQGQTVSGRPRTKRATANRHRLEVDGETRSRLNRGIE